MNWRTEVKVEQLEPWSHTDKVMCMGSCFAENIGNKLNYYLFDSHVNPFGITFNPLSIASQLNALLMNKQYSDSEIQQQDDRCFHFQFHGQYSKSTIVETIAAINQSVSVGSQFFSNANKLVLTFGSAYYYEHKEFGLVNNCHKQAQIHFTKKRATVDEMIQALKQPIVQWLNAKKNREVVLTVSPVRHWKDGVVENNRSKASLLLLTEALIELDKRISYFPSYEIVLDELRDYRFYASDLLHINQQGVDYVWTKFCAQRLFLQQDLMTTIKQIQEAASHKPFDVNSIAHQKFVKNMLVNIEKLKFHNVSSLEKLTAHFKNQLIE